MEISRTRCLISVMAILILTSYQGVLKAESVLSQQAATLPAGVHSVQLELGYPIPVIWLARYNYGISDWFDLGLNGAFIAAKGHFGMVGAQAKIRMIESDNVAAAFSLLTDYFNSDEGDGLLTHPAFTVTWMLGDERYLVEGFVGSYVFIGDIGFSCFTLCSGTAISPNKSDVYVDPGLGFEMILASHWSLFLKGYALINAENGRVGGGGSLGVAANW